MSHFVSPTIHWACIAPLFVIFGGAILGVLFEAFLPRKYRYTAQMLLALLTVALGFVVVVWRWTVVVKAGPQNAINNAYTEDIPAIVAQAILIIIALFAVLTFAERTETGEGYFAAQVASKPGSFEEAIATRENHVQTEVFPLMLFSLGGMLVFCAASDLLTLFVALEVLSLPLYVLTATARRRRLLSQEGALKYFLLGAFASAFFIFGTGLVYGVSASVNYVEIFGAVSNVSGLDWMLVIGVLMVLVGLLFKVGAAPFHMWIPDVYQGAPTPVTGFMAAATKLAAFAAITRFVYVAVPGLQWDLRTVAMVIIVLTMLIGTVMGIVQQDIKRVLAYSSIAHAGFILIAVFAFEQQAISSILFYLLTYGLATVGAFAVVGLVRRENSDGNPTAEATSIDSWAGIGQRNPVLAVCMTIFLLSFAGIPLTGGFIGKFIVFAAGVKGGMAAIVVLAVLCSAATAYFYFRVIVKMFFAPMANNVCVVRSDSTSAVAVVITALFTLLLGVMPQAVIGLIGNAMVFIQ